MKEEYSSANNNYDVDSSECENLVMDHKKSRYPYCIVWTPIPILTWIIPVIGHMGIALSSGIIRDFAGPYFVSEDNMAFGKPAKYWQLDVNKARNKKAGWDAAITEASEVYKGRMHNLFCDNCHSHVALALNLMHYDNCTSWNMIKLWFYCLVYGKYVSFYSLLKTWVPFILIGGSIITIMIFLSYS